MRDDLHTTSSLNSPLTLSGQHLHRPEAASYDQAHNSLYGLVKQAYDQFAKGDYDACMDMMADDAVILVSARSLRGAIACVTQ